MSGNHLALRFRRTRASGRSGRADPPIEPTSMPERAVAPGVEAVERRQLLEVVGQGGAVGILHGLEDEVDLVDVILVGLVRGQELGQLQDVVRRGDFVGVLPAAEKKRRLLGDEPRDARRIVPERLEDLDDRDVAFLVGSAARDRPGSGGIGPAGRRPPGPFRATGSGRCRRSPLPGLSGGGAAFGRRLGREDRDDSLPWPCPSR